MATTRISRKGLTIEDVQARDERERRTDELFNKVAYYSKIVIASVALLAGGAFLGYRLLNPEKNQPSEKPASKIEYSLSQFH